MGMRLKYSKYRKRSHVREMLAHLRVINPTFSLHDAGTHVDIFPERKSVHIQIQVRTKTTGIIVVQFSDVCGHLLWLLSGRISKVCSVGIQCCICNENHYERAQASASTF